MAPPGRSAVDHTGRGSPKRTPAPSCASDVSSYDVRYIRSDSTGKATDSNWTVQDSAWTSGALDLPAASPAGFTDTAGNVHAANIDALAAAGITLGCSTDPLRYCPDQPVTRAQMASFLHRALRQRSSTSDG